ncbi:MAG TPA: hypothetical protein VF007_08885 [Stellaceae bacterium]
MQLEDLAKPNLLTLLGLGVAAIVLPELVPSLRPALKSAVKIGVDLLVESQGEAEAELMRSLVSSTLRSIDEELSKPADEKDRREAVNHRIRSFQHKARTRAARWNSDEHQRRCSYREHVAQLQAGLVERKQDVGPGRRKIIDDASTFLAQEIG